MIIECAHRFRFLFAFAIVVVMLELAAMDIIDDRQMVEFQLFGAQTVKDDGPFLRCIFEERDNRAIDSSKR